MGSARVLIVIAFVGMLPARLIASVSYEADSYPELDGWTAVGHQDSLPLLTRSVQDGIFTISAAADAATNTSYGYELANDSAALKLEWRNRTSNDDGVSSMQIRLEWGTILVSSRADEVLFSYIPPDNNPVGMRHYSSAIEAGAFHTYALVVNEDSYTILVNDISRLFEWTGQPVGTIVKVQFGFGKDWDRIPTQSEWDYVRVTPVPEPATAALLGLLLSRRLGRRMHRFR